MENTAQNITIAIVVSAIILTIGTVVVFNLDSQTQMDKRISGIAVYVNGEDTTATHIKCAIYTANGERIGVTNEVEFVRDSWNWLPINGVVIPTRDREYILAVQGDGDVSIPANGNEFIINEGDYGAFPTELKNLEGGSSLSIYAIYEGGKA